MSDNNQPMMKGLPGAAIGVPPSVDFTKPQAVADYLAAVADGLYTAMNRIQAAQAHASLGEFSQMDEFLAKAVKPLTDSNSQFQRVRHEREHILEQSKPAGTAAEGRFAPMSWDALPEKPPAFFAVADLMTLAVVIHSNYSDWRQVSDLDRDKYLLYDISLIGKDNADYNWNLNATYPILVATPIAAAGV